MAPAAAPLHQANSMQWGPVEAAPGPGVLKPHHLDCAVTLSRGGLFQCLVMAVVTTAKGDIKKDNGFTSQRTRKWTQIEFSQNSSLPKLTDTFCTEPPHRNNNPPHRRSTVPRRHYKATRITYHQVHTTNARNNCDKSAGHQKDP